MYALSRLYIWGSSKLTEYLGNIVPKAGPSCKGALNPPMIASENSLCQVSTATHNEQTFKQGRTKGPSPNFIAPR